MRALDPHTRRASLSSGVEAAHSAKNLNLVMVKMSMMMMMVMVIIMTTMMIAIATMMLMMMDTFEFLAALLQMHWADSKL